MASSSRSILQSKKEEEIGRGQAFSRSCLFSKRNVHSECTRSRSARKSSQREGRKRKGGERKSREREGRKRKSRERKIQSGPSQTEAKEEGKIKVQVEFF